MKPESSVIRLNKYLAHAGVCSRRDADRLIEQGKVLVNGRMPSPGQGVSEEDEITVDGRQVRPREKTIVLAFYKPVGVTCTERDVHAEKTVTDMVHYPVRVTYAGRLDRDSEGLLLLSNDGDLIQGMMRGANCHEKEYAVRVDREITPEFLEKMAAGIYLKDLGITTRECRLKQTGKRTFRIVLTQGVNRQIRRMCAACGWKVETLKRIRIMNITLKGLKPGEFTELTEEEIEGLYRDCGINPGKYGKTDGKGNADGKA